MPNGHGGHKIIFLYQFYERKYGIEKNVLGKLENWKIEFSTRFLFLEFCFERFVKQKKVNNESCHHKIYVSLIVACDFQVRIVVLHRERVYIEI